MHIEIPHEIVIDNITHNEGELLLRKLEAKYGYNKYRFSLITQHVPTKEPKTKLSIALRSVISLYSDNPEDFKLEI